MLRIPRQKKVDCKLETVVTSSGDEDNGRSTDSEGNKCEHDEDETNDFHETDEIMRLDIGFPKRLSCRWR